MEITEAFMWRNICLLLAGVLHVLGSGGPLDLFHSRWMTHPERDDSVFLLWGYDREVQEMSLEIQTPLSSAIVLGLGPDKSLNKTDFVVAGWNEHGETYFYDAHTEGSWPPVKDKSQDYELLNLSRNKTHTVMKVWRQWFTCDRHDHEIENDTVRVMVVIGSGEPLELTDDNTFRKSIFFLEVPDDVTVPEILLTHEFRMNNFLVPDQDTTYACTFLPIPRLSKKHHIIRYEVIEDPDTIGIVHHILIYMCGKHTVPITEVGDCYGSDIRFFQCTTATFGWAVGGEPFNYPAQTGVSIGAEGDPQYVRIEIHYSNFELKEGLMDSSGIRIYYTPEIRPYDSETLGVGIFTLPLHFIPPGSKEFRSYGLCNTSLMEEISDEPIPDLKVTSYLLHGHLTARGVRTLHYRNGTLIGSLGEDKTYDFNFQQVRSLPKEVTIKMGDQIVVECLSSTMDKEDITFGGTSTLNEMCITFLFYYPASSISLCVSYTDIFHVTDALGMEREDSIIEAVLNMDTVEWNDETRATAQKAVMEANQLAMVWDMEGRRLNRTCPLPPISLPPPYHCEGDSLDLYIWDVYKEILEVTCMENKFIPYSYGTLDFQMLLDIVYDTSEEGISLLAVSLCLPPVDTNQSGMSRKCANHEGSRRRCRIKNRRTYSSVPEAPLSIAIGLGPQIQTTCAPQDY
ncbi:putative DBH-like monooxygenase protein 2 [Leptodactylus fuscus]|uniref:putative DBH-like monooxygenase protein 2 n=1 Tax=Leptodactylus fuscus TaxID=238119 RepID=UPI003F4E6602